MKIRKVLNDKKAYIDLLLLADEQESMIDKYLERGEMFVLDDNGVKAECVVTKLKNIAVMPEYHRKGYGKRLSIASLILVITALNTALHGRVGCYGKGVQYRIANMSDM